jgi:2'-5' RNA ligase
MSRLFIAIDLPERIKDALIDTCSAIPGADWIDEARLHCTLRFIGDTQPPDEQSLVNALRPITLEPFTLTLNATGIFPNRGKPRILWAGIANSPQLMRLQRKIEQVCVAIGLPREQRHFHPHITIARLKMVHMEKLAEYIVSTSLFKTDPFEISEFHLYNSITGKQKAHYEKLVTFSLMDR